MGLFSRTFFYVSDSFVCDCFVYAPFSPQKFQEVDANLVHLDFFAESEKV